MRHSLRVVSSVLLPLLAVACSDASPERPAVAADGVTTAQVQGAVTVASLFNLPLCFALNRGSVYYAVAEKKLTYCDGSTFRPVDTTGLNGKDGVGYIVTTANASAAQCPGGGVIIAVGPDANRDGLLDSATSTTKVCNGAPGKDGANGANGVDGTNGRDGANGKDGANGRDGATGKDGAAGKDGANGVDGKDGSAGAAGKDGIDGKDGAPGQPGSPGDPGPAGPAGQNGTNGTNGTNGAQGNDSLIRTDPEPAGASCANGGLKVRVGLDTNRNGALEDAEVSQTSYLCSGAGVAPPPPARRLIGYLRFGDLKGDAKDPAFKDEFEVFEAEVPLTNTGRATGGPSNGGVSGLAGTEDLHLVLNAVRSQDWMQLVASGKRTNGAWLTLWLPGPDGSFGPMNTTDGSFIRIELTDIIAVGQHLDLGGSNLQEIALSYSKIVLNGQSVKTTGRFPQVGWDFKRVVKASADDVSSELFASPDAASELQLFHLTTGLNETTAANPILLDPAASERAVLTYDITSPNKAVTTGGAGVGKSSFGDPTLERRAGSGLFADFESVTTGASIPTVTFLTTNPSGTITDAFENAYVTTWRVHATSSGVRETAVFDFAKLTRTTVEPSPTGPKTSTRSWNMRTDSAL